MSAAHDTRFNPLPADLIDHPDETELLEQADKSEAERWRITDDGAAEWAMRRLAEIRRAAVAAQAQADEWIFQIEAWLRAQVAPNERSRAYFESLLVDYATRRRVDDDVKTLNLPSGSVTSRAAGDKVKVIDTDAFLDWAQDHELDQVVRWKREPVMAEVNRLPLVYDENEVRYLVPPLTQDTQMIDADGEVAVLPEETPLVPGVVVEAGRVTYTVSPS